MSTEKEHQETLLALQKEQDRNKNLRRRIAELRAERDHYQELLGIHNSESKSE